MDLLYPLMLKLSGKRVVIVGGGRVALRKAQGLAVTGAVITIISPKVLPEILSLNNVEWQQKRFEALDVLNAHIIYAATDCQRVNQSVAEATQHWQWFNDTSDAQQSDFYTPAVIRDADLTLSVSTNGRHPAKAKRIKRRLMDFLKIKDNTIT